MELPRRLLLTTPAALLAGCGRPGNAACDRVLVASVPLRLIEGYPIVPASLAGQGVTLLLDTGAQGMLVTPEVAEALRLPLRGTAPIDGTGGVRAARVVALPGLRLGEAPMPEQLAPVLPLPVGFELRPPLAGLLGGLLLSRFDLDIDVPGGRVSLFLPVPCPAPFPGTTVVAEVTRYGELFLPVRVNGRTLLALLDTGTRATIIDERAARSMGVQAPGSANVAEGVDGTRRAIGHTTVQLSLGDEAPRPTPVSLSALRLERGDMLLGLDALLRRRTWLSYARGEVTFGPLVPFP